MWENPDLLKSALKSTGIIYYFLSTCWQTQVSTLLSQTQLQNFWYYTKHGNVYLSFLFPSAQWRTIILQDNYRAMITTAMSYFN